MKRFRNAFVFLWMALIAVSIQGISCGGGGGGSGTTASSGVQLLVYAVDDDELFVTNLDGPAPVNLSDPMVSGGDLEDFTWSPNRQYLAFRADKDVNGVVELYVVSLPGGTAVKVSGTMTTGGDVAEYEWAPDSSPGSPILQTRIRMALMNSILLYPRDPRETSR